MSDDATKPSDVPAIAPAAAPAAPKMAMGVNIDGPVVLGARIDVPIPRPSVIHSQRAWGGRMTVEEAWADGLDLNAKCTGCGAPRKMVRCWIRTYMPLPDFHKSMGPIGVLLTMQKHGGVLPILETIHGPMVWLGSNVYACSLCAPTAEKAAAQHPSWCLVEVRKPPKAKTLVQVPRGARA